MKLKFSQQIFERNSQIKNLIKILHVEADFSFSIGRTDKRKLIIVFRSILETDSTKDFWNDNMLLDRHL